MGISRTSAPQAFSFRRPSRPSSPTSWRCHHLAHDHMWWHTPDVLPVRSHPATGEGFAEQAQSSAATRIFEAYSSWSTCSQPWLRTSEEVRSMARCPQGLWVFRLQTLSGPNLIPVKTRRWFRLISPCCCLAKRCKIQQTQLLMLSPPPP